MKNFIKLFLFVVCLDSFVVSDSIGNIRLAHIFGLLMFLQLIKDKVVVNKAFNGQFLILGSLFGVTFIINLLQGQLYQSTFNLLFTSIFNLFLFYVLISSCNTLNKNTLISLLKEFIELQMLFSLIICCLQFFFAFVGLYKMQGYGDFGFLLLGRPGGFFIDPNWLCNWIVVLFLFYYSLIKAKLIANNRLKIVFCIILAILILAQSRVGIVSLSIGYYFIKNQEENTSKIINIAILFLILGSCAFYFLLPYLPPNLYYDLISKENNPRLHDLTIITDNLSRNEIWFGKGWGSISSLNIYYDYLNWSNAINILPGQIYFEFGIFGVLILVLNILLILRFLNSKTSKIIFAVMIFYAAFHNPTYKQYYWTLLALIVVLDLKFFSKKNINYEKVVSHH